MEAFFERCRQTSAHTDPPLSSSLGSFLFDEDSPLYEELAEKGDRFRAGQTTPSPVDHIPSYSLPTSAIAHPAHLAEFAVSVWNDTLAFAGEAYTSGSIRERTWGV